MGLDSVMVVLWSEGFPRPALRISRSSRGLETRQSDEPSAFTREGWTARPPPAIMAGFGAAPPSASVDTPPKAEYHSAVTPDANREHPDQGCAAIALVRVSKPTDRLIRFG